MQCSCGGITRPSTHTVSTRAKKVEWLGIDHNGPITIDKETCAGCGRQFVRIFDADGKLIKQA